MGERFFPDNGFVLKAKLLVQQLEMQTDSKKMLSLPVGNGLYQPFLVYFWYICGGWFVVGYITFCSTFHHYDSSLLPISDWRVLSPCLVLQVPFWLVVFPLDI